MRVVLLAPDADARLSREVPAVGESAVVHALHRAFGVNEVAGVAFQFDARSRTVVAFRAVNSLVSF